MVNWVGDRLNIGQMHDDGSKVGACAGGCANSRIPLVDLKHWKVNVEMKLTVPTLQSLIFVVAALLPLAAAADWMTSPEVFEPTYYADHNPDVRDQFGYDTGKLMQHWRTLGIKEGRASSPVFDARYYLKSNPDVAKQVGAQNYPGAAQHWYETGIKEGRPSSPDFHVRTYLQNNPDIAKALGHRGNAISGGT